MYRSILMLCLAMLVASCKNPQSPAPKDTAKAADVVAAEAKPTQPAAPSADQTQGVPAATEVAADGPGCPSDGSQADLTDCAAGSAGDADKALNETYQKVLAANSGDKVFVEKFKKAQRAWLAFRDAQLDARYPDPANEGSVGPMCRAGDAEELTRQRTVQLQKWVDDTEEGDVCSGSYPTPD